MHVSVSDHFVLRAYERLGYDKARAVALGKGLFWAIDNRRDASVTFIARVSRDGKRLFRFRALDGRYYYALLDTENRSCVTIMPPGYVVGLQGKEYIKLKDADL